MPPNDRDDLQKRKKNTKIKRFFKNLFCFRRHSDDNSKKLAKNLTHDPETTTIEDIDHLFPLIERLDEIGASLKKQQEDINTLVQNVNEIHKILKKPSTSENSNSTLASNSNHYSAPNSGSALTQNSNSAPISNSNSTNSHEDDQICQLCHSPKPDEWCSSCDPQYFIDHFSDWTSGNSDVDSFIQVTQRNASNKFNFLEWIPYTSLKDIKYISKGGFGTIYSATWIDGPRTKWLHETSKWGRYPNVGVALKSVESKNVIFEELQSYLAANKNVLGRMNTLRIYGMTRNPEEPEKYMMVMLLADDGDLGHYIRKNFSKLTYLKKLEVLFDMITGIVQIHQANLVHRDLHQGNILCQRFIKLDEGRDEYKFVIGDLGLTRKPSPDSKIFYGIIPYCAPEVLESAKYSEASDIYSFGIIMWELAAGVRTFANRDHDELLMNSIISGLRPQPVPHIPNSYEILMKQCWAPNPNDRPSSQEIYTTIGIWLQKLMFTPHKGISQEFLEADEKRLVKLPVEEVSPGARYYSSTYHTINRMGFSPLAINSGQINVE